MHHFYLRSLMRRTEWHYVQDSTLETFHHDHKAFKNGFSEDLLLCQNDEYLITADDVMCDVNFLNNNLLNNFLMITKTTQSGQLEDTTCTCLRQQWEKISQVVDKFLLTTSRDRSRPRCTSSLRLYETVSSGLNKDSLPLDWVRPMKSGPRTWATFACFAASIAYTVHNKVIKVCSKQNHTGSMVWG